MAAELPHHVMQRGNRRQTTFFRDADYEHYRNLLAANCARHDVFVWAWCLMPNHVHLLLVPKRAEALAKAVGETHKAYTRRINAREGWHGFLWQGRFAPIVMDEPHALMAARYVELNPVRAKLVRDPADWRWSSARHHLDRTADGLTSPSPIEERVVDWQAFLEDGLDHIRLREALARARPLGGKAFIDELEVKLGRSLPRPRRNRPKKQAATAADKS